MDEELFEFEYADELDAIQDVGMFFFFIIVLNFVHMRVLRVNRMYVLIQ